MLFSKHFTVKAKTKIQLFFQVPNISQLQFAEPLIMHTSVISLANSLSTTPHPINTCSAMKSQIPIIMPLYRGHTALNAQDTHSLVLWSSQPHNLLASSTSLTRVWPYELTDKTKVCRNNLDKYLMYLFKTQNNQNIQVGKKEKKLLKKKIATYTESQLKFFHKSVRQPSFTTAAIQNNIFIWIAIGNILVSYM